MSRQPREDKALTVVISVPYAALTKAFSLIEGTTKRLEKNAILTSFLLLVIQRSAEGDNKSLLQAVYLCINRVSSLFMFLPFLELYSSSLAQIMSG
jgi:type III secretory pathway component EscT